MVNLRRFSALLVFSAVLGLHLKAQVSTTAQVGGTIVDSSGAAVPEASVVLANTQTGVQLETKTNETGSYLIPQVNPGLYKLTATKKGFETLTQNGVVVRTGDRLSIGFTLRVGSLATEVTVSSEATLMAVNEVGSSQVIDNKMITSLPQLSRSSLDLINVVPAASGSGAKFRAGQGYDLGVAAEGSDVSLSGGQVNGISISVDGAAVQDGETGSINRAIPTPDMINEFRVQTGVLSADVGRYSGGVISVSSQTGSNQLHGRLFEYFRNDSLNSNGWMNNALGVTERQPFHQNNYGAAVGGPVLLPRLYDGRNRTFFHFAWEGERYVTSSLWRGSVPTELERQGDFSKSIINYAGSDPIYARIFNPFDGFTNSDGNWVRPEFSGARLPQSQVSSTFRNYLGLWPAANHAPDENTSSTNNYWTTQKRTRPSDRFSGRLDHNIGSNHRINGRLTRYYLTNLTSAPFVNGAEDRTTDHNWTGATQYTWVPGPTTILDVQLGFSWAKLISAYGSQPDPNINTDNWNLDPVFAGSELRRLKNIPPAVSHQWFGIGYAQVGGNYLDQIVSHNVNGSVSLTKILGKHTIKTGFQQGLYKYAEEGGDYTGALAFVAGGGSNQFWDSPDGLSGHPLAEMMLGSSASLSWGAWNIAPYYWSYSAFVMDDWKLSPKVTIQAGLRWDFDTGRKLRFPQTGQMLDLGAKNVIQPNAGWNWNRLLTEVPELASYPQPAWVTGGINGKVVMLGSKEYPQKQLQTTDWNNFQPRLGISWAITPESVLRLGGGIVFQGLGGVTTSGYGFYYGTPSFSQVPTLDGKRWVSELGTDRGLGMFPQQSDGSLLGYYPPIKTNSEFLNATLGGCASPTGICGALLPHLESPSEYVWSASLQRKLGRNWILTGEYQGIRGIHLLTVTGDRFRFTNVRPEYYGLAEKLRTQVQNPFFGQSQNWAGQDTIRLDRLLSDMPQYSAASPYIVPWGKSIGHYANFQIETRFWNGLSLMASYAIRKTLSNTSGKSGRHWGTMSGSGAMQNPNDWMEAYAVAPWEVPQSLLLNYLYELPLGKGKRWLGSPQSVSSKIVDAVVGGWSLAGYSNWIPKGVPMYAPRVNGSVTVPTSSVRWSVKQGADYLNGGFNPSSAIVLNGQFTSSNPDTRFKRDAYVRTSDYSFGNVPIIYPNVRQPGSFSTDATLMKNFYWSESRERYINLRIEALNAFNYANYGSIEGNPDSPVFGGVYGKNGIRTVQIGLRVFF